MENNNVNLEALRRLNPIELLDAVSFILNNSAVKRTAGELAQIKFKSESILTQINAELLELHKEGARLEDMDINPSTLK